MYAVVEVHVDSAALLRIDVQADTFDGGSQTEPQISRPGTVELIDDRCGFCGHRR
jgi:hypothetical protein